MKSSDALFYSALLILNDCVFCMKLEDLMAGINVPLLFEENILVRENECGLPAYTNSLPLQYRRNLRRVWANFPLGSKSCSREMRQTQAIMETLPAEMRSRLVKVRPTTVPAPLATLTGAPLLSALSETQKLELNRILADTSLSEAERVAILKAWASSHLESSAQSRFDQTLRFLTAKASRFQEKVAQLSAEARMAIARLDELRKQKLNILNRLSQTAREELAVLWRPKCNSVEEIDPDVYKIACVHVNSTTEASLVTNPFVPATVFTTPRGESATTTTTTTSTTSTTISTTQALVSKSAVEVEVFRKPSPDSGAESEEQENDSSEKQAAVVVSASVPPSVLASMDSAQLAAILRRIFPNSHFQF